MIKSIVKWIEDNKKTLTDKQVQISVQLKKRHEELSFFTTAIVEFKTINIIGNIILYISGECEVHIFSNDEEKKEIFIELYEPQNEEELFELLKNIFHKVTNNMF